LLPFSSEFLPSRLFSKHLDIKVYNILYGAKLYSRTQGRTQSQGFEILTERKGQ